MKTLDEYPLSLTIKHLAELRGVSPSRIYQLLGIGALDHILQRPREPRILFSRELYRQWVGGEMKNSGAPLRRVG